MRTRHNLITGLTLTIVGLGGIGLAGAAFAADSSVTARATETIDGRITKVDRDAKTFILLVKATPNAQAPTERLTVKWNEQTECLLDGESSTPESAIKPGLESSVTHEEGMAIRVESKTPKPE
ncbi:MAG: hypothetical protein ACF8QF_03275 [Phycisphaerales bacterium]